MNSMWTGLLLLAVLVVAGSCACPPVCVPSGDSRMTLVDPRVDPADPNRYLNVMAWELGDAGSEEAMLRAERMLEGRGISTLVETGHGWFLSVHSPQVVEATRLLYADPLIRPFVVDPRTGRVFGAGRSGTPCQQVGAARSEVPGAQRQAPPAVGIVPVLDAEESMERLALAGDLVRAAGVFAVGLTTFRAWLHVKQPDVAIARRILLGDARTAAYVINAEELSRLMRGEHPIRRPAEIRTLLERLVTSEGWREAAHELALRVDERPTILAAYERMLRETMTGDCQPFEGVTGGRSLERCIAEPRCRIRWAIAASITEMKEPAGPLTDVLLELDLRDEGEVSKFSWGSLVAGQLREAAVPTLRRRLRSDQARIRAQAIQVLGKMPTAGAPAAADLRERLGDSEWNVRFLAVGALANVAPTLDTLETLKTLSLTDPNEQVRAAAQDAVERIRRVLRG
jgi:hypothetical protein